MNSEQITAFLQAHWEWVTLIMGIVSVAGSILNWNWMCETLPVRGMPTATAEDTGVWCSSCWVSS